MTVNQPHHLDMNLTPEEEEMIALLQDALALPSREEVIRLLVKQAVQRIAITCPACGHYARLTDEGKAECQSCLSVISLAEDILLTSGEGS
ncbi:MAG TPA: hypothetical protein EYP25_03440 [Anaerolineae bacterium]|nr:transposase [Caldilineae bacterium]HID33618.1 hypothetical protein [Anaerolineae bacterium]HIQ11968.1 hypothetical protein [Caldilineales bacterium]